MYTFIQILEYLDSDPQRDVGEVKLAFAAELIAFSRTGTKPFPHVLRLMISAIEKGYIELYFDRFANCVGVILWAMLSQENLSRIIKDPEFSLTYSDFDSGENLYVLESVFVGNNSKPIFLDLKNRVFKPHKNVIYSRIKNNKRIFKKVTRG